MNKAFYQKELKPREKQYCECGKIIYLTWEHAQHQINVLHNRSGGHAKYGNRMRSKKVPVRVYHCPICQYYHTTSHS